MTSSRRSGALPRAKQRSARGLREGKLELLLAEIEHAEAGQSAEARLDVSALHRELGLR